MAYSRMIRFLSTTRTLRRRVALLAVAVLPLGAAGCNEDEAWDAFRSGASDQLQAGVESIVLGVVNGAFSAWDLQNGDAGSANTSGASAGSASRTP